MSKCAALLIKFVLMEMKLLAILAYVAVFSNFFLIKIFFSIVKIKNIQNQIKYAKKDISKIIIFFEQIEN